MNAQQQIKILFDILEIPQLIFSQRVAIRKAIDVISTAALTPAITTGDEIEVVFGRDLKFKAKIENGSIEILAAVNGWGDAIPLEEIAVNRITTPPATEILTTKK